MAERLDGKVAIVTGAGRGLGRAEAIELASLGASVVVNDLEVGLDGGETAGGAAEEVVEVIRSAGGQAVAHGGDVADFAVAEELIKFAVDQFGDLNILVNNAGILRDRMIFNMDESDWDAVIRVHLKGHFCMSRWATTYWRAKSKEKGGPVYARIVNTSSEAFLFGSAGQPNYASAKAGIVGLTLSTAQACGRYGVLANAIAPRALTRMTEGVGFDPETYAPENVSPLVAWLASPAAERVSGQVFVAYGSTVSVVAGLSFDQRFETDGKWTVDSLDSALASYFDKREPVTDGFAMPVQ
ncbi:MAG TPA: SDR family NAD(P)-dependent oxidoreductase [Actinomycetota bacterium]|nr:SDR family NAD(P)-dependent oxidoreductase [Actinomycetota bacterium]